MVAPNVLDRRFDVRQPNTHWVTDITYIRTHEGWLYLAGGPGFVLAPGGGLGHGWTNAS